MEEVMEEEGEEDEDYSQVNVTTPKNYNNLISRSLK